MTLPEQDLVLRIYDCVADNRLWGGVLDRIADDIGAKGCILFEWDTTASGGRQLKVPYHSGFFERELIDGYLARCGDAEAEDQDLFEAHSLRSDPITLVDDSILTSSLAALKAKRNVELLQKFGILHRAAGLLNKDNTLRGRFSVQLGIERGGLTARDHAYLSAILPHVAKALDLGRPVEKLARETDGLLSVMDMLSIGVCILDRRGMLIASNTEFARQREDFGHATVTRNGELRLTARAAQDWLEHLMTDARHHGKFGARPRKEAVQTGTGGFLCLELAPLNRLEESGTTPVEGYVLYCVDTSRPITYDTDLVTRAFGLTRAESELVDALSNGLTNAQIADQRGRAVQTINAQVKSILSKTDCGNRTQLVRCLMGFGIETVKPALK